MERPYVTDAIAQQGYFYLVWCLDRSFPTVRYSSRHAAETEAKRLAAAYPGFEFYVVKTMSKHIAPHPVVISTNL